MRRADWWPRGQGEHEVSFAIELFTLELHLFHGARRDAEKWKAKWDPRRHLTGTIDWIRWSDWIDDLKTGHWPIDPATSKQLRSYALVPWLRDGRSSRWEGWVSITQWERYPLDGLPKRKGARLTALDLEEHLADLRWAVEHPTEANPEAIYVGPWDPNTPLSPCAFCECREPLPANWVTNFRYRAAPHCLPGMMKRLKQGE